MFGSANKKFFKAATDGDVEALDSLADYDVSDINVRDKDGKTALFLAAENGRTDAVKLLIDKGADVNATDKDGVAPLLQATVKDKSGAALALIAAKADVNTHGSAYAYPLHWAANNGDTDVVKALVAAGAEVNVLTKEEERTSLYYAILKNRGAVAEILLAAGARPDIPGTDGKTDRDLAASSSPRILKLIEDAKAAPKPETSPTLPTVPAPAQVEQPHEGGETWVLMGPARIAHVGTYPAMNRKITEVFNFAGRERVIITENLKTGAETLGASEKFEAISGDAVAAASEALKRLGGDAERSKRSFTL